MHGIKWMVVVAVLPVACRSGAPATGHKHKTAPATAPAMTPGPPVAGVDVPEPELIKREEPIIPQGFKTDALLTFSAVIGKDGNIRDLKHIKGDADPEVIQACEDAITQWKYKPSTMNGEPVEITHRFTVSLHLK